MTGLTVIAPGLAPTLQDLGRPHVQNMGVPPSGALDPIALRLANALIGNPANTAAIEIRLMGPTVEVTADSVRVALVGSNAPIEVLGDRPVQAPSHQSLRLEKGRQIRVGGLSDTGVAYLAVEGGFDLPPFYDSLSTYARAGFGGFEGRPLQAGDQLPTALQSAEVRGEVRLADQSWRAASGPIRVVLGPQQDYFTPESLNQFCSEPFTVSREADRMGMRLDGPVLSHALGHDIVSDGIVTGAIQVPGNGRPIILLADHQTTGGYPKLGAVISADLPRLGRMRPGDEIRFEIVSVEEAEAALRRHESELARMIDGFASTDPWLDLDALYRENLISGIVADQPTAS